MSIAADAAIIEDPEAQDLAKILAARRAGDWLGVYDASSRAIREGRSSEEMRYSQALALANIEDTQRALALFEAYGLGNSRNSHKRALRARLLKDQGRLDEAYEGYRAIFDRTRDSYHGINAASIALLSGRQEEARTLAKRILRLKKVKAPEDYYCAATRAEALLILGDAKAAHRAIKQAVMLPGAGPGPQSGTLRQLARVAPSAGVTAADMAPLLDRLCPPASFHYAGHMFVPDAAREARIRAGVEAVLDRRDAGFAYGSLAAGADIIVAEAVLDRGGELNLVLPCALPDFIAQSVRPPGEEWVARAERCLERAGPDRVSYASKLDYVSDPSIFTYGGAVAMGLARLHAQQLATRAFQLAVWDGKAGGPVGTGADVRLWRAYGGETEIVAAGGVERNYRRPAIAVPPPLPRRTAAILFTDYAGFSRLSESAYPVFDSEVMGRVAQVLARHESRVIARNTWGDALYAVLDDAIAGAEFAIDLQQALKDFDGVQLGLEAGRGGMRIALHYGSIYQSVDRVTGQPNFLGNEVARAARIEPVTPPGDVYVTEPFAAMIALHAPDRFRCRYVGQVDLAKKYGAFPMYRLTAASGSVEDPAPPR
jgi:adenylate cyclase